MSSIVRTVKITDPSNAEGFRVVNLEDLIVAVTAVLDGLASDVAVTVEDIAAQASAKLLADAVVTDPAATVPTVPAVAVAANPVVTEPAPIVATAPVVDTPTPVAVDPMIAAKAALAAAQAHQSEDATADAAAIAVAQAAVDALTIAAAQAAAVTAETPVAA